jgi:hypothetical protein
VGALETGEHMRGIWHDADSLFLLDPRRQESLDARRQPNAGAMTANS